MPHSGNKIYAFAIFRVPVTRSDNVDEEYITKPRR